jgi:hypothetical protein
VTTAPPTSTPTTPLLLPRENGRPLDRHTVTRLINKAGTAAGLAHIHPHQLRHTLATQAINRGMTLEAIAALLGHCSLDMTLRYAKIANRTVADEYFAVTEKVESLYQQGKPLPADIIGPRMARLRREHHRLLGNGYCTRPPELDCAFEAICETCTFFQTSIEFRPTLQAQHDHAARHDQTHRADLFTRLLNDLGRTSLMINLTRITCIMPQIMRVPLVQRPAPRGTLTWQRQDIRLRTAVRVTMGP